MSELAERKEDLDEEKRQPSDGSKKSRGKKEGIDRRKGGGKGAGKKEKARGVAVAKGDRAGRGESDVSEPGIRQERAKARREGKGGGGISEGSKKHPVGKGASAASKNKQKMKDGDSSSVVGPLSGEAFAVSNGSKGAPASTLPITLSVKQKKRVKQNKAKSKKGGEINHEVDGSKNVIGESGAQRRREESMGDGVAASATKKWPSVKRKKKVGRCLFSESSFLNWVFNTVLGEDAPVGKYLYHPLLDPPTYLHEAAVCYQMVAWRRYWLERFVGVYILKPIYYLSPWFLYFFSMEGFSLRILTGKAIGRNFRFSAFLRGFR